MRLKLLNICTFTWGGGGAATGSERMALMVKGLIELLDKYGSDLTPTERTKVAQAKDVYYSLT